MGYIQPIGENASPNTTIKATDYHDFGIGAYLMAVAEMSKLAADDANLPKLRMTGVRLSDDAARITVKPANDTETADLAKLIRKIREEYNCSILLVEHDMGLVMDVCDNICAISFGKMLAMGTPSEIQENEAVRTAYLGHKKAKEA